MCISIHHTTSKSRYHDKNEDNYFIGDHFIIVADGMGGESNGDIASRIAVDTISNVLTDRIPEHCDEGINDLMFNAIIQVDKNIANYVDEHPESYGMGTTVLLMIYQNDIVSIAWCGDSRCYAYNDGKLCALTTDHSYVQELIDAKKITIEDSFSHPDNNLITRFVGGGETTCKPEYITHHIKDSEVIILCSDGLSGYCKASEIENTIISNHDISSLPEQLTKLAIAHGSDDDITIVTFSSEPSMHKHSSILDWFRRK